MKGQLLQPTQLIGHRPFGSLEVHDGGIGEVAAVDLRQDVWVWREEGREGRVDQTRLGRKTKDGRPSMSERPCNQSPAALIGS